MSGALLREALAPIPLDSVELIHCRPLLSNPLQSRSDEGIWQTNLEIVEVHTVCGDLRMWLRPSDHYRAPRKNTNERNALNKSFCVPHVASDEASSYWCLRCESR